MAASQTRWRLAPLVALVLIFAASLPHYAGFGGPFVFDSIPNIAANDRLHLTTLSPAELHAAAWSYDAGMFGRPVPMLTLALDWWASGGDPARLRLTNLAIHAGNTLLVFTLAFRLLDLRRRLAADPAGRWTPDPLWTGFLAALLWALAPVHGFTVLYVVQRMVLLAGTFSLLALLGYLALRQALGAGRRLAALGWLGLTLACGLLALGSKETAVLLPVYVLVIEGFLLGFRGLGRWRPWLKGTLVVLALAPAVGLLLKAMLEPGWYLGSFAFRDFDPLERVLTQARVLASYLGSLLLPIPANIHFFNDNFPISRGLLDPPATALALGLWVALVAAALALRRVLPLFGFAVLWFLGGHLLEAGPLSLELVFWHRNYLPALGPLLALAYGALWLAGRPSPGPTLGYGGLALLIALSGLGTWLLASDWGSAPRMAASELAKNPGSSRANYFSGRAAVETYEQGGLPVLLMEAEGAFERALDADPRALLPAAGLAYMAVHLGQDVRRNYLGELERRIGQEHPRVDHGEVAPLLARLCKEARDADPEAPRITSERCLDLFLAAEDNPRMSPSDRATWMISKSQLLGDAGAPREDYLRVLREAVALYPSRQNRLILLRTLVGHGELAEARALADGFTPAEARLEPDVGRMRRAIEEAEAIIRAVQGGAVPETGATP